METSPKTSDEVILFMKKLQPNIQDTLYAYELGIGKEALANYVCLSKQHLETLKHACYVSNVGFIYACKIIYLLHEQGKSLQKAFDIVFNNIGAFNTDYVRRTMQGAIEIRNYYYHCSYFYVSEEQAKTKFRNEIVSMLINQ